MLVKSVLSGIFCTAILILAIPIYVFAQQPQRNSVLGWYQGKPVPETKVLEIIEIKVEGKPVLMGQPFSAGKGWLKTLVLRVRNISAKPVQVAVISFNIPELDKEGRKQIWDMPYNIQRVGVSSSGADVWDYVGPGDEVKLAFTDRMLKSSLHELVEKMNGEVYQVNILPETISKFKDGSSARGGFLIN